MFNDSKILSNDWYRRNGKLEFFSNLHHKMSVSVKHNVKEVTHAYNVRKMLGKTENFDGYNISGNKIGKRLVPILKSKRCSISTNQSG